MFFREDEHFICQHNISRGQLVRLTCITAASAGRLLRLTCQRCIQKTAWHKCGFRFAESIRVLPCLTYLPKLMQAIDHDNDVRRHELAADALPSR